jgi:hypothetical protein
MRDQGEGRRARLATHGSNMHRQGNDSQWYFFLVFGKIDRKNERQIKMLSFSLMSEWE